MSRASTYSEISSLGSQLASETQVKKRREAGQKLLSLLSNPGIRARLAKEATPSSDGNFNQSAAKNKALSQLWRVLIRNALMASAKATGGRGKLNVQDVVLPYRFLCLCDAQHQDENTLGTKLSRTEILDLLKYCLDMLNEEDALAVAENDLLTMLHHLCGREDYVVHYRPHGEINNILAELDSRLQCPALEESTPVFLSSAKTFCTLLQNCQSLSMGMHLLIPSCIEVVSNWCGYHVQKINSARGSSSQALPYMLGAATALMVAHPEQVIAPLSRHGRPLLSFAKRCFPPSQGFHKAALTEFFLAHVIVCQAAGSLQGLLPGDLGNVGSASLDVSEIDSILSLIASETELEKVLSATDSSLSTRHHAHARYKKKSSQRGAAPSSLPAWSPLGQRQRCHLELCARLLACAQRIHVANAEWNVSQDPLQAMVDKLAQARKEGDEYCFLQQPVNPYQESPMPKAHESEIAKCPWMTMIARHLWMVAPQAARLHSATITSGSQELTASQESSIPVSSTLDGEQPSNVLLQHFPVLNHVSLVNGDSVVDMKLVVHLLQVTCACAEAFPGGECWSSSSLRNWRTIVPDDLLENDVIHCSGCCPKDLALVVFLVSNILEQSGGHGGDAHVQTWALLCLIRLTETSAVVFQRFSQDAASNTDLLSLVWRRVWGILLKSDLLYASATEAAVPNSNGEFVLVLLTEIVRNCCTDPSVKWSPESHPGLDSTFMHANQWQIWRLPAFSDALSIRSSAAFELVYVMLVFAGLSEQGRDVIDGRAPHTITLTDQGDGVSHSMGRKRRLVNMIFRKVMEATEKVEYETNRLVLAAASASLSVLLSGEAVLLSTTFPSDRFSRFRVTEMSDFMFDFNGRQLEHYRSSESFFESLWGASRNSAFLGMQLSGASRFDFPVINASNARHLLLEEERRSLSSKSPVSSLGAQSEPLRNVAMGYMQSMLPMLSDQVDGSTEYVYVDDGLNDSNGEGEPKSSPMSLFALSSLTSALKIFMSIAVPNVNASKLSEGVVGTIESAVLPVFEEIVSRLPSLSSKPIEFLIVSTDLLNLLDAITKFFLQDEAPVISRSMVARINDVFDVCWSLLAENANANGVENEMNVNRPGSGSHRRPKKLAAVDLDSDFSDHASYNNEGTARAAEDSDSDDFMGSKRKRTVQLGQRAKRRTTEAAVRSRGRRGGDGVASAAASSRPPNGASARMIASIVILLRPCFDSCQLVAETLLWPCLNEEYANNGLAVQELDPGESTSVLALMGTEKSIFHHRYLRVLTEVGQLSDVSFREDSIIPLCCAVIRAIRAASGPSLQHHLLCFLKCADLVVVGESDLRGGPLSMDDCKDVIGVLMSEDSKVERRSLKSRPQFRSARLRAATRAFRKGREMFHRSFDHMFAAQLVIPSLSDVSEPVRSNACLAVSAALGILEDQRRIFDSVLAKLPPLTRSKNEKKVVSAFRRWYEEKDLGSQGALTAEENVVWDDARLSLEATSVTCRGFIAGSTTDSVIFRDVIWDLVRLSSARPDLECACFIACERASLIRGFRCAEEMLQDESEWLIRDWLETGMDISSMPLLMTSPSSLRQLLKAGQGASIGLPQGGNDNLDINQLRVDAVSEYVKKSAHLLVPIILFLYPETLSATEASAENSSENEASKPGTGWEYLVEACSHLDISLGSDYTNVTKVLLRSHLPDVLAYILPLAQEDCAGAMMEKASKVLELLEAKLAEVTSFSKQRRKKAHSTVRRILQLCGKHEHAFGDLELPCYVKAVLSLLKQVQETDDTKMGGKELFDGVNISVTECLLYAKAWLHEFATVDQQQKSFTVIEVLCDLVSKQLRVSQDVSNQLGFCIHVVVDIALEVESVRNKALAKLREILSEVFALDSRNQKIEDELSSTMRKLLGTLLHLHESSQQAFLAECSKARRRESGRMKRCLGLVLLRDCASPGAAGDLWGWNEEESTQTTLGELERAVREHARDVDKEVEKTIFGTYDVLELLLDHNRSSPDSLIAAPLLALSRRSQQLEFLATTNERLYAQSLVQDAFEASGNRRGTCSPQECLSEIRSFAKRLTHGRSFLHLLQQQSMTSADPFAHPHGLEKARPGIEETLLLAELHQVCSVLRRLRQCSDFQEYDALSDRDIYLLVQELLKLCDSKASSELRCAASRCLGELGPARIDALSSLDLESLHGYDVDTSKLHGDTFLPSVRAKALELLSQYLKSPKVQTSLAAMETIKALLSTDEGIEACRLVTDNECKRLLHPLRRKNTTQAQDSFATTRQLENLKISVVDKDPESSTTDSKPCWRESLWVCVEGGEIPYESWIRRLVCSILMCFYEYTEKSQGFFQRCLKMSALEHGFAAVIFPGIVFDLLHCQGDDMAQDAICKQDETLASGVTSTSHASTSGSPINRELSQCFATLIGGAIDRTPRDVPDSRAVALAVDALDMLRLVTQHHFMSSKGHKMNPRSLTNRSYPNQSKSNSRSPVAKPSLDKSSYNKDIEPAPKWGGVPFGIALNLDSLQVARACLLAKRYASALFYAEMYADNHFGGSTGSLERVSNELVKSIVTSSNVTGAAQLRSTSTEEKDFASDALSSALALAEILQRCYLELHEFEAFEAVETSVAALQFSHDDSRPRFGMGPSVAGYTLDDLRVLDRQRSIQGACASSSLLVANCMEDLGLKSTLRTYIEGLVGDEAMCVLGSLSGTDRLSLRDKWFEGTLQMLQWDERLTNSSASHTDSISNITTTPPMGLTGAGGRTGEIRLSSSTDNLIAGFYESMSESLVALLQDDTETCCRRLTRARHCLLDDIQKALAPESVLIGMVEIAEKLQVLNDLDDFATGDSCPKELESRWGIGTGSVVIDCDELDLDLTSSSGVNEFSSSVREIVLRIMCFKKMSSGEFNPKAALIRHLWWFCLTARHHGKPDVASASLQRLRHLSNETQLESTLRMRFEEAKNLESRGNFSSAIRTGKLVVSHVNQMKTGGGNSYESSAVLLSDALLKCGVWMNEYKVEPAETILQKYLKPATEMARASYEQKKSRVTAARSSSAYCHLAELAANLFDSVSARTQSLEWKKAAAFVTDRQEELKACQELMEEKKQLHLEQSRKKRKSASVKENTERYNKEYTELYVHTRRLQKELELMTSERKQIEESIPRFLLLAIESYGAALSICDSLASTDMSRHVFRMVSLWFSNCADGGGSFNRTVGTMVDAIPSFRFVPLTYQIFSRVGSDGSGSGEQGFQEVLGRLVRRMCAEHPYHCLVQLLALSNGNKVGSGVDGRQADDYLRNVGESKVAAANEILTSLRSSAPSFVSNLIDSYTVLIDAYVDLANAPTEEFHKAGTKGIPLSNVPGSARLDRCLGSGARRNFSCPPCVLTTPPPLRPGADYGDGSEDPIGGERVQGFQPTFSLTETGIHRPKIIKCIGTKGNLFKQLVKGKEDVRSDAVMEQVFMYVNDLMKRHGSSSRRSDSKNSVGQSGTKSGSYSAAVRRQLKLVTYGVVPLSPTCGVLEWVVNTVPFGDYLVDKGKKGVGAHSKYYPGEWGQQLCRLHYQNAPAEAKREAFDVICDHFSPAFRFFFVERFSQSLQAWHTAKMTYTRSCAVSSIVGHMLGIGDRHIHNILVHEKTGEVVHIDFGIVFEQGKSLTIPETVPFRLTRDIVDGMGPCGTEGTFSRAAEATAAVLRENANALLTILSAVVADPLYRWSVSPIKAREVQRTADDEDNEGHIPGESRAKSVFNPSEAPENQNEAATRALSRIHEKLQGYEDGTSGERQSVEGQVQLLINSARDPNNLCKIFHGWAPWM